MDIYDGSLVVKSIMGNVRTRRTNAEYASLSEGCKFCVRCDEVKPVEEFYKDNTNKSGYQSTCKVCRRTDKERYNTRDSVLKSKYGISEQGYFRLLLLQEFRCAICGAVPEEQRFGVLEVDHSHATGEVRGLLCTACNLAIGKMQEDPERLLAAAGYLMARRMEVL